MSKYDCGCKKKGYLIVDDTATTEVGKWLATDRSLCFRCWQDKTQRGGY